MLQTKIQRWHLAMRGWDDVRVLVVLEEDIWYWAFLEWLFFHLLDIWHEVRIPKFLANWKRAWDKDDPTYVMTLSEWSGDCLGCYLWYYVNDPILQRVWKHKGTRVEFDLSLDEARAQFAHDPSKLQWIEDDLKEREKRDECGIEKDEQKG